MGELCFTSRQTFDTLTSIRIGQKLSERVESFHFTHAINGFRREINVELGNEAVKSYMRKDLGGIMTLPVRMFRSAIRRAPVTLVIDQLAVNINSG